MRELEAKFQEGARKTQSAFLASPTLPEVVKAALRSYSANYWPYKITVLRATECERALFVSSNNSYGRYDYEAHYPSNEDQDLTVWNIKVERHVSSSYPPSEFHVSRQDYYLLLIEEKGVIKEREWRSGFSLICQQDKGFWSTDWQNVPRSLVGTWTAPPYEGPMKF